MADAERLLPTIIICFTWVAVTLLLIGLFQSGQAMANALPQSGLTIIGGTQYQEWQPYAGRTITSANISTEPEPPGGGETMNFQSPIVSQSLQMTVVRNNSHVGDWNPFYPAEYKKYSNCLAFFLHLTGGLPWDIYRKAISYEDIEQAHNLTLSSPTVMVVFLLDSNYTMSFTAVSAATFHHDLYSNTFNIKILQVFVPSAQEQQSYSWTNLVTSFLTLSFPASTDFFINSLINVLVIGPFYLAVGYCGFEMINRMLHG